MAYSYGNHRLSCALCVLASLNDLINGAVHNPDTYREYCRIEAVTGYSFCKGFWLSDVKPELLPQETLEAVRRHQRGSMQQDSLFMLDCQPHRQKERVAYRTL